MKPSIGQTILTRTLGARRAYLGYDTTVLALADFILACEFELEKAIATALTSLKRYMPPDGVPVSVSVRAAAGEVSDSADESGDEQAEPEGSEDDD